MEWGRHRRHDGRRAGTQSRGHDGVVGRRRLDRAPFSPRERGKLSHKPTPPVPHARSPPDDHGDMGSWRQVTSHHRRNTLRQHSPVGKYCHCCSSRSASPTDAPRRRRRPRCGTTVGERHWSPPWGQRQRRPVHPRQENHFRQHPTTSPQQRDDVMREPAGPRLKQITRLIHNIIKLTHHQHNLDPHPGEPEFRVISKMVNFLSTFIKPALPTKHTLQSIIETAQNWGHTTLIILQQHYVTQINNYMTALARLIDNTWGNAFAVAERWAKRNLPRLTAATIEAARTSIEGLIPNLATSPAPAPSPVIEPAVPPPPQVRMRPAAPAPSPPPTRLPRTQAQERPRTPAPRPVSPGDTDTSSKPGPSNGGERLMDGAVEGNAHLERRPEHGYQGGEQLIGQARSATPRPPRIQLPQRHTMRGKPHILPKVLLNNLKHLQSHISGNLEGHGRS